MARAQRRAAPARAAPRAPAAQQPAPPATQQPQQRQPGMFAQMASTAAGVAVGSTVGHVMGAGITSMFSGGSREQHAPQEQQQMQQQPQQCDHDSKQLMNCLNTNKSDISACQFYLDMLKQCQEQPRY